MVDILKNLRWFEWALLIVLAVPLVPLCLYWLVQLATAFVGVCYYLVVERTLAVVFSRTINRTRVRTRWYYIPLLIAGLLPALLIQFLVSLWAFLVWWHRSLGRWQWGGTGLLSILAAIVFEITFVLVFIGGFYHPLPWRLMGGHCPSMIWYRQETVDPVRELLTGPVAFAAIVLLLLPTIFSVRKLHRLQRALFLPSYVLSYWALFATLKCETPLVNGRWLIAAGAMLYALILFAVIAIGLKTLRGHSNWRQFISFSAVRLLEKKRIALFSLAAVCLCTAMLLIIVSIMGGFVEQIRNKTHEVMGDIILEGDPARGFPYYEGFLAMLKSPPLDQVVDTATPVIYAAGLLKIPDPFNPRASFTTPLQVNGIDVAGLAAVCNFGKSLHYCKDPASLDLDRNFKPPGLQDDEELRGLIHGLEIHPALISRDAEGNYRRYIKPYWPCVLTVIPISHKGTLLKKGTLGETKKFYIVDDSRTGVYNIDANNVYVGFKTLQKMLWMERQDVGDGKFLPARTHQIRIKLREGVSLDQARATIHFNWMRYSLLIDDPLVDSVQVKTWEDFNRMMVSAVENEKKLMVLLFGIISIVTVFLVLCVFYMIVVEKTRDVGILKSIGASSAQVAAIFLAYAGVIGAVGSAVGAVLGWCFVRNINVIEKWLIRVFGWRVWDRKVYAFDEIPNTVDTSDVIFIVIAASSAAIVGAIIPALRAAKMNPVEALRYE